MRLACAELLGTALMLSLIACGGCSSPSAPVNDPPPPNYAGNWAGTYIISSCTNTGFFADVGLCSGVLNTTADASFALTQSDRVVTGTFVLGALTSSPFAATIFSDGSLVLVAPVTEGMFTIDTTWTLHQATAGAMTGQARQIWRASGQSGESVLQGTIVSVTRAAAAS